MLNGRQNPVYIPPDSAPTKTDAKEFDKVPFKAAKAKIKQHVS